MTAEGAPGGPQVVGAGPEGTADQDRAAAWGVRSLYEPRWPAVVAVGAAMAFQLVLPDTVITGLGPRWFVPGLEGAFAVALLAASPNHTRQSKWLRIASITMIAIVNAANLVSLGELVTRLVNGTTHAAGRALVFASVPIWLTNVVVFGLWYWELDRGGPAARLRADHRAPDFLFPQMATAGSSPGWTPNFVDYIYTSFTNATAFSPTDTMPLSTWAKLLMMLQSFASLATVALVFSRAINILS